MYVFAEQSHTSTISYESYYNITWKGVQNNMDYLHNSKKKSKVLSNS